MFLFFLSFPKDGVGLWRCEVRKDGEKLKLNFLNKLRKKCCIGGLNVNYEIREGWDGAHEFLKLKYS